MSENDAGLTLIDVKPRHSNELSLAIRMRKFISVGPGVGDSPNIVRTARIVGREAALMVRVRWLEARLRLCSGMGLGRLPLEQI